MRVFCSKNGRSPTIELLNETERPSFIYVILESPAMEVAVDEL